MLRPYQEEDFDAVLRILTAPEGAIITKTEDIRQNLASNHVIVCEENSQILGFALIEIGQSISQVILYVDPTQRGQGLGSRLWDAAQQSLIEVDQGTQWVFYRQDVGTARNFYAHRGCQVWYSYDFMQYRGPALPDPALEWRLYREEDFGLYYPARNAAFYELESSLGAPTYDNEHRERIRRWASTNQDDLYLFFDQGQLVGSLVIIDQKLLDEVFVCPGVQRGGWGRKLMQFAVNRVLSRGLQPELVVVTTNHRAKALYDALGFESLETLEMARKFKPGHEPDYRIPGT